VVVCGVKSGEQNEWTREDIFWMDKDHEDGALLVVWKRASRWIE
jgi:hypothetical protein